jgi:hypothetical protein
MKKRFLLIGFALTISVSSCIVSRVASLATSEAEGIELYTTKIPERSFVEISYIQTEGSAISTPQQLLNGLKKKAIQLNADAIINIRYDFRGEAPVVSGTAIRYKDE